ncbi:hypothetical protein ACIA8O_15450 [Kitasatospora sp. NPDC051853]|uniref:hypothetical protein n=1 Tax=Kitasatospora sp. NPDC051853 TaxID=3364058 RepID=UPI003799767B
MSGFTDGLMLRLGAPGALPGLLLPADATGLARVRQLVGTLYGLPAATVHEVARLEVAAAELQRPLFRVRQLSGSWIRTAPAHERTEVLYEGRDAAAPPEWADLMLRLTATLVLELDPGAVESVTLNDIGEYQTLAEFQAKFRYFDLDGYLARHRIGTVDELRRAYRHLLGEIRLAAPPPFDPAAPANRRRVPLELAVLVRESVDLTASLRAAQLVRDLAERGLPARPDPAGLESRGRLAPVLVFPAAALAVSGITETELSAFFAAQDVLAIVLPP